MLKTKRLVLLLSIAFTMLFNTKGVSADLPSSGLDYIIEFDKKTKCEGNFPPELAYFFQQYDGYEENSEVVQISKILRIDLSIFQKYESWHSISSYIVTIDNLLNKIKANPNYYKRVKYNKNSGDLDTKLKEITNAKDKAAQIARIESASKDPAIYYPPDNKYLSSNLIKGDLMKIKNLLDCQKKGGATKLRLILG